jgi:hypothetical protein
MGVREELMGLARRVGDAWETSPSAPGVPWVKIFELEATLSVYPLAAMRRLRGRVNAAEICGVPAGHLLSEGFRSERIGEDLVRIVALLVYREVPWNWFPDGSGGWREITDAAGRPAYSPADFEELLAALEPGTSDADSGTWRDRPSMLGGAG